MKNGQIIISISREFGSGGHAIAEKLAQRFSLPIYDHNLLRKIASERNLNAYELEKYDEIPRKPLFSKTVKGHSSSPEVNIAYLQFNYLKEKAARGESFIVVGRCSEEMLKEFESLITIFILGDMDTKIKRIAEMNNVSFDEAERMILDRNKTRKAYHNSFCNGKWGDSRNYELSINSSKLGIVATTDLIENYIRQRIEQ